MELEQKIYTRYAFEENETDKRKINRLIRNRLMQKYKVFIANDRNFQALKPEKWEVVIFRKPCYHHTECKVVKNTTKLSKDELALLCDEGYMLCYGYRSIGFNDLYIFED